MNGAEAILRTLADAGLDVCFANPGTSEMHLVAALDAVPRMRAVLTTFEGVATGAADGYARMAERPAATLLHLGPGLGNGLANLHNARRAHSPVCSLVGEHATYHRRLDAPLESDIAAIAGSVSGWVRTAADPASAAGSAAEALAATGANGGQVATLVVPSDVSWGEGASPARPVRAPSPAPVSAAGVDAAARVLRSDRPVALLFGGQAGRSRGLRALARVAGASGARIYGEHFPARIERGAGLPHFEPLGYVPEHVQRQLAGVEHVVLAGARSPVSFFAYPGVPGDLVPAGARVHRLAGPGDDVPAAIEALADALGAPGPAAVRERPRPPDPDGELTVHSMAAAVSAVVTDGAVVVDESNTSGVALPEATAAAPHHDWLALTGGAIGSGLPLATGAAVAAPDRPVLCLEADGSALYTIQALAAQAREGLDVTTLLVNNGAYAILRVELARLVGDAGATAADLLDLARPELDFRAIAQGMGVPASRAATAGELVKQLRTAMSEPGPHLVEALVPPLA